MTKTYFFIRNLTTGELVEGNSFDGFVRAYEKHSADGNKLLTACASVDTSDTSRTDEEIFLSLAKRLL